MSWLVDANNIRGGDVLGGKGRAIAELTRGGFPVPPWVVLTPTAFEVSLGEPIRGEVRRDLLERLTLAPPLERELIERLRTFGEGELFFAVRSSAVEEDSVRRSFAGQLRSFLFVTVEEIADRVADVWRSGFSERVLAYRRENGLQGPPDAPAVVIQRMIDADASGVAFSADPVTGERDITVVGSVYGLGTALVDGEVDADTHRVDDENHITERAVAQKKIAHRPSITGGIKAVAVDTSRQNKPVLGDDQLVAIAELSRRCQRFFGRPQDIEWAIQGSKLYLLQSRPITSLFDLADKDGAINIWDNSNIAESYGGMTTPLTFSFARNAYEGVYRQLCRTFGVPRGRIQANSALFANMLGLVRGRIYYNLLNWYRFLALLPGYQMNRGFMEQMMGVKESLPDGILETRHRAGVRQRFTDGIRFAGTAIGFSSQFFTLRIKMRRFYDRLDRALDLEGRDLAAMRADELVAEYRVLESQLLSRWDAPLINDFYTMIFYGVLRKLCRAWCADEAGTLQNDLLCGSGGMVSTEPAQRMREMADIARRNPEFVDLLCNGEVDEIREYLEGNHAFQSRYEAYLEKFGERCYDELKLESPTLHDDPLMLFRAVGHMARPAPDLSHAQEQPDPLTTRTKTAAAAIPPGPSGAAPLPPHESMEQRIRIQAEARVADILKTRPVRRRMFAWVLRNARDRVRGRENLRLERTRLFGRVRRIFVELGRRFYDRDLLDDARDIFYLDLDEVLGFVEGTATCTELKRLARLRKDAFAEYGSMDAPADRFETRGMVYVGNTYRSSRPPEELSGDTRTGIGCCPGLVSGPVRVVRDPRQAVLEHGDILIAERTDPSWIMLFPFAAGLVVERGSLLSHSAIVAREMGIPAVVSVTGAMAWLADGDWVQLNGSTGVVQKTAGKT